MEFKTGQNLLLVEPDIDREQVAEVSFVRHLPNDFAEVILKDYIYEVSIEYLWPTERREALERSLAKLNRAQDALDEARKALDAVPRT